MPDTCAMTALEIASTWVADTMPEGMHAGNPGGGPKTVCTGLTKGTVLRTECAMPVPPMCMNRGAERDPGTNVGPEGIGEPSTFFLAYACSQFC